MKKMEQDELLTVQEFAEKAGVSVQAVYKRLNNSLNPYIQLVEGRKMIKLSALSDVYGVEVEQPIKPFVQPIQPSIQPELNKENSSSEADFLRKQVEQLQAELSAERQHSRELAEKIAELAEKVVVLTDQSQKLQLAQMSPQLSAEQKQEAEPKTEAETETPKKPWWKSLFS